MQLFAAAEPGELELIKDAGVLTAHLAYKIGGDGRLYRARGAEEISGGIMSVWTEPGGVWGESTVSEIITECAARKFTGVLVSTDSRELVRRLSDALSAEKLSLFTDESLAADAKGAGVLVSTVVYEGTLRERLSKAAEKYGAERIMLDIEPIYRDFTLPCPTRDGAKLSFEEFSELSDAKSGESFFSSELCCNYFVYFENGNTHLVLYDTAGTVKKKLRLAQTLKLGRAIFAVRETKSFLSRLFD